MTGMMVQTAQKVLQFLEKLEKLFSPVVVQRQVPELVRTDPAVHSHRCSSWTRLLSCPLWPFMVQTVPKPVEFPQVQFLGMVDVPAVAVFRPNCRNSCCGAGWHHSFCPSIPASLPVRLRPRWSSISACACSLLVLRMIFCISRCIPLDYGQAQVARHHDRYGPVGQFFRWRHLGCRGGQCCQESNLG